MANKDKYGDFDELRQGENTGSYRICLVRAEGSDTAIIAPHGGKIEKMTSELAKSIAGRNYHLYQFEGLKKFGNRDLHITSTNFDEPQAITLITECSIIVTVHGLGNNGHRIKVGGLDHELGNRINNQLLEARFVSNIVTAGKYAGMDEANICNRGLLSQGVQLEIERGLRESLKSDAVKFRRFTTAVRNAIENS